MRGAGVDVDVRARTGRREARGRAEGVGGGRGRGGAPAPAGVRAAFRGEWGAALGKGTLGGYVFDEDARGGGR